MNSDVAFILDMQSTEIKFVDTVIGIIQWYDHPKGGRYWFTYT